MAIGLGVDVAKKSGFSVGSLDDPILTEQIMITGNAALSWGQPPQDWIALWLPNTCYNNFDLA